MPRARFGLLPALAAVLDGPPASRATAGGPAPAVFGGVIDILGVVISAISETQTLLTS